MKYLRDYQPTCAGVDSKGELVWTSKLKERWQLIMFKQQYTGDFGIHWMWKSLQEKGADWNE